MANCFYLYQEPDCTCLVLSSACQAVDVALMSVHNSATLHSICVDVQTALTHEAQQADRLRMDGHSAVPSRALIHFLNEPSQSDSVVLFLRALAAYHMLTHQQAFELMYTQFDEEERSVVTTASHVLR